MSRTFKIAVLPGDGVGPEVMQEALKVLDVIAAKADVKFEFNHASSLAVPRLMKKAKPCPLKRSPLARLAMLSCSAPSVVRSRRSFPQ